MSLGDHSTDVAIIGAGPAGLTAAYLLSKSGYKVTVIEKDSHYVGGISRTVEHNGFRFDIGGHRFFSKSKEVVDLWNEILPDDFIQRPRMSRIYYEGKFYSYPLRAFEALWNLGIFRSTLCMMSYVKAKAFPKKDVRSFQDWVVNQFGHKLFSIFFKTYTEKVWGMPCDEMSADWAAQRIKGLSLGAAVMDGLKRSLGLNKKPNDGMETKTLLETFRYPRLGPGMMWDAARDHVVAKGNHVLMAHSFEQLWPRTAGTLAPAARMARWSRSTPRMSSAPRRCASLPTASSRCRRQSLEATGPQISRFPDRRADDPLGGSVPRQLDLYPRQQGEGRPRAEFPQLVARNGARSDHRLRGPRIFLLRGRWRCGPRRMPTWSSLPRRKWRILGLCKPEDVVGGAVVRQEKAYPVYDDGYAANVEAMRDELEAKYPTLHMVGRNGMHRYNNQDHAMMTAMLTVRNIEAGCARL
jgi:protoporphyrinogen oxidase